MMENNNSIQILKDRLESLEEERFYIDMIDHWSSDDRKAYEDLTKEIELTKKELEKYGVTCD